MGAFDRRNMGLGSVAVVFLAGVAAARSPIKLGTAQVVLDGKPAPAAIGSAGGFRLLGHSAGPQLVATQRPEVLTFVMRAGESAGVTIRLENAQGKLTAKTAIQLLEPGTATVAITLGDKTAAVELGPGRAAADLEATVDGPATVPSLKLDVRAAVGNPTVQVERFVLETAGGDTPVVWSIPERNVQQVPPPPSPDLRPAVERLLIEHDWRLQDGIGTERRPTTYAAAVNQTLDRGKKLLAELRSAAVALEQESAEWAKLTVEHQRLLSNKAGDDAWADLWRRVHWLRRRIVLANPLAGVGRIAFVKHAPSNFSHQLTEYLGRFARPGGGVFVLDEPGKSMKTRRLAAELPMGAYQHLDVAYEGDRLLFSYCKLDQAPKSWLDHGDVYFHLYETAADGSSLRQLTGGPDNDFSPRYLPNGQFMFISTRRGGWHRCGGRPGEGCENYTLALANADGSHARPVSYHETQEWDPAVLDNGQIIYTRWDYVDRHAVYYEQLWTVRPDGSYPAIYYGNNTFNPVGLFEPMPIPGSTKVMATTGAHHAMTAGSIVLVDVTRGVDGPAPLTRLTPDALFPESETHIPPAGWHAPAGLTGPVAVPVEQQRWPGHCYKSPFPLSEQFFLASYSFDSLIGEPAPNPVNMFGLYLVDAFGNKELLYRDLAISSVWGMPLRARPRPPIVQPILDGPPRPEGTFMVQNVYAAEPPLPKGTIKRLRIVQVLPKTTAGANYPPVGLANASPGKQVLGTVPVEPDGSAHFRAPAGIPLSFQALDALGQAVQVMRSVVYLQPGEVNGCVGCHEPRSYAPPPGSVGHALMRPPSTITPGPDGSKPLSFPLLVQPVLDRRCVSCHNRKDPQGEVVLTGEPEGSYTAAYNALAQRVSYSVWGGRPGDFRIVNSEPLAMPDFFGARGSSVMKLLHKGHYDVKLTAEEIERLATWMDANALFYGTFDFADQERQRRGERIAGPGLQ